MIISHEYHGERSLPSLSSSSAFLHRKENGKNRCFGTKTFVLFLLAISACIGVAVLRRQGDLRSTTGIDTFTSLYYHSNYNKNLNEGDGVNKSDRGDGSTNIPPTNIAFGSVSSDSDGSALLKQCIPDQPDVIGCDVGERCTKLSFETTSVEEENDNAHHQRSPRIRKGASDGVIVNGDESEEREAWYCLPESYASESASSSIPMNIHEVRYDSSKTFCSFCVF